MNRMDHQNVVTDTKELPAASSGSSLDASLKKSLGYFFPSSYLWLS